MFSFLLLSRSTNKCFFLLFCGFFSFCCSCLFWTLLLLPGLNKICLCGDEEFSGKITEEKSFYFHFVVLENSFGWKWSYYSIQYETSLLMQASAYVIFSKICIKVYETTKMDEIIRKRGKNWFFVWASFRIFCSLLKLKFFFILFTLLRRNVMSLGAQFLWLCTWNSLLFYCIHCWLFPFLCYNLVMNLFWFPLNGQFKFSH